MNRTSSLSVVLAVAFLTVPLAMAHSEAPALLDLGELAPVAAPVGGMGSPARSGETTLAAAQTPEGDLVLQSALPGEGWVLVAVREPGSRESVVHGAPADLHFFEAVAAHVAMDGTATLATGTLLHTQVAGGGHLDHDATGEWLLALETAANPFARAEATPDGRGGFLVTLSIPSDAAQLEPGRATEVRVLRGEGDAIPQSPFVSQLAHESGSFQLYAARAGETAGQAERAAQALRREPDPLPSVAAALLVPLAVAVGALAALGLRPASAAGPVPQLGLFERRPGRAELASFGMALLLVAPLFVPAAAAASEDPDDFLGPVARAGAPRDPCAEGAPVREYNVSAIDMDIVYNRWGDHDPQGMMYVLDEQLPAVLEEGRHQDERVGNNSFPTGTEESLITPLVLRAALGECLLVHFTNRLGLDPAAEPLHEALPVVPGSIDILDFQFMPGSMTVVAGSPVTWTNLDPRPHTVAFLDGSFSTGPLLHDVPSTHVFSTPGTYTFICDGVESMPGTLVVLPPGSTLPAEPHSEPAPACGTPPPPPPGPDGPAPQREASIHVHGLPVDPLADGAGAVGRNPLSTVPPGGSRDYRLGASTEGVFFMHDHGDPSSFGLNSFASLSERFIGSNTHGLFGAVVVEPAGATWTNAYTGAPLVSGWRADVHVPGAKSFREFVLFYHDPQVAGANNTIIPEPKADHGLNYRIETLSHRLNDNKHRCDLDAPSGNNGINPCEDISLVYSSNVHGDPATPIPRAYTGDLVKFRLVHAGMEQAHVHHLHNHRWRAEDGNPRSTIIDSQTLSPSETWTETLEAGAGGEDKPHGPGDSIYHCHLFPHLYGGMWGIFRVHDRQEGDLRPLPTETPPSLPTPDMPGFPAFMFNQSSGHRPWRAPNETGLDNRTGLVTAALGSPYADVCPPGAPERRYHLTAIETRLNLSSRGDFDPAARIFAFAEDADAILAGEKDPDPVVLRARAGECIVVKLENRFPFNSTAPSPILGFGKVSIHPHLHAFDVLGSDGVTTGWNFDQTIWPGEEIYYRYYADKELQTVVWHDHANGLENAFRGVYGATIIEPANSDWRNPVTGGPIYTTGLDPGDGALDSVRDPVTGTWADVWRADIVGPDIKDFREFFASIQDFVPAKRANDTYYRPQLGELSFDDFGTMGFNLRSEPLWHRTAGGMENLFNSSMHGDPATNLWEAYPGDPVVVRFHQVAYEELHTLVVDGHRWRFGYDDPSSPVTDSFTIGVSEAFNAYLECGAGGCARSAGDYLYRGGSMDDLWPGAWGIFRVHGQPVENLRPLDDRTTSFESAKPCPPGAKERWFNVHAIQKEMLYNSYGDHDPNGLAFVLDHEVERIKSGLKRAEPLVLRVGQAECVKIRLTNDIPPGRIPHAHSDPHPTGGYVAPHMGHEVGTGELLSVRPYQPGDRVGLHAHLLTQDVQKSGGGRVGYNLDSTVGPNESRVYAFYADVPVGTVAILEDLGDIVTNRHHGLFGAILVQAPGSFAVNPKTGIPDPNIAVGDRVEPNGTNAREVVLFQQSGVPLVQASGRPVPIREAHGPIVDAGTAAGIVMDHWDRLADHAGRAATITLVEPAAPGFAVHGRLGNQSFRAWVTISGELDRIELRPEDEPFRVARSVRLTGAAGEPIPGLRITLERTGADVGSATGSDGIANFSSTLIPETLSKVRFIESNCTIPVRADFDGGFQLDVRAATTGLPDAALAADAAIEYLKAHAFPPGPVGIRAVDVTGTLWRVVAEDALRVYRFELQPASLNVTDFSFEARAKGSGLPAYLPEADVVKAAELFLREHYGAAPAAPSGMRLDRFGAWRVEYDGGGIATSLRLDAQTGRVLALVRGPAGPWTPELISPDGPVALRFRLEGGIEAAGVPVFVHEQGTLVGAVALREGGRFVIPYEHAEHSDQPGDLRVDVPALSVGFPIDVNDGHVEIDIGDVLPTSLVPLSAAVELASSYFHSLTPPGRTPYPWGVTGLDLAGDGAWHVGLATGDKGSMRIDVRVDSVTGRVLGATIVPWDTAIDRCSSQVQEHLGPHPAPQCASSFTVADEEDQGAKAFNYRSEPYENRLVRVPDPSLVYSSRVHRDPATPLIRAYSNDPVTIHLVGMQEKGRVGAFSIAGHMWPFQPDAEESILRQGQGGLGTYRVFRLDLAGGAGGPPGFDGDYLYQGPVQRFHTEIGEWGLMRVYGERIGSLRNLSDAVRFHAPPPSAGARCNGPTTRTVDAVFETTGEGVSTLGVNAVVSLSLKAMETTELRLRLVDGSGRPLPSGILHADAPAQWVTGESHASNELCVVLTPPREAAGQKLTLSVAADVDGIEASSSLQLGIIGAPSGGAGPGASPTPGRPAVGDPMPTPGPGDAPVPGPSLVSLLAALGAASAVALARRRRG